MKNESIFIDTEAFFHKKQELLKLSEMEYQLITNNVVIYEFIDVISYELEIAKNNHNERRIEILTNLRERFPKLIIDLGIVIKDFTLTNEILLTIYQLMDIYKMSIGDIFHLLTIKEHTIKYICNCLSISIREKNLPNLSRR